MHQAPIQTPTDRLRHAADLFIHHWVTEFAILVLILISVSSILVELALGPGAVATTLGITGEVITALFIAELAIRFFVARNKARFFSRYWIDILAVIPLVRPLRIFRVLRLFRAGILLNRRSSAFRGRLGTNRTELTGLAVGSFILVASAAMVLHSYEGRSNIEFREFEDALWFAAFSLIGGEPIGAQPATSVGRWTTLTLMLGGMTLFGMFVGTVSAAMVGRLSANLEAREMDIDELVGHVVVCGWNRSGPTVLRELFAEGSPRGRAVVLVTETAGMPPDIPHEGVPEHLLYHQQGDYTLVDVLEGVGLRRCSIVILLRDELIPRSDQDRDARTVLAALTVERMVPEVYTVAELHSDQNEEMLRMAGVEEIVIGEWYAGVIIGSVARNQGLVRVLNEILTSGGNRFHTLPVPAGATGKTVAELHTDLFVGQRAVLIAIVYREGDTWKTDVNPDPERKVAANERMVVLWQGSA